MKILCVGYYDKFSRFFLGIKKELKKTYPALKFKISSVYFSGFFYTLLRGTPSSFLSFKAWGRVLFNKKKYGQIIKNPSYKNIQLEELIAYQLKANKKVSKKHLLLQAVSYIDLIDEELAHFHPDFILLIGDSRLPFEITKILAERYKIKIFFVEQGPFNTTVFDEKGVNANASIHDFPLVEPEKKNSSKKIETFLKRPKAEKYHRSPFYRGIDFFIELAMGNGRFYPPDLKISHASFKKQNLCNDKKKQFLARKNYSENIFFFACQVPFDVNMTHHGPHFKDHFSMLKSVHKSLPENSLLVVREHPVHKGKYDKVFYDYLQKKNTILVDCNKDSSVVLNKADVVVVNNSTVGLEAIVKQKAVVVLGNSYYDHNKLCLKLDRKTKLKTLLAESLNFQPDKKAVNLFFIEFLFHHLIDGFITDRDLKAAKTIAQKIGQAYQKKTS